MNANFFGPIKGLFIIKLNFLLKLFKIFKSNFILFKSQDFVVIYFIAIF